ncbi:coiled-coil domain-containing protein 115 [Nasonia vitripennis]|uniref:Vacuolar ATPase assembly protein VMA22 n=1 Tax=Nasonia vitripennis TaxID=7425 RepID=A0A7M7PTV4_NASVI|nr:coiled-coil domain-containing protein 115 [Nasonia vitripennis]
MRSAKHWTSLFDLETSYSKGEQEKIKDIPNLDISLKKSNKEEETPQDPIKWFGVLVPQSLKTAQKHFQDALYLAVKIANVQAQLTKVTSQSESLKLLKKVAI